MTNNLRMLIKQILLEMCPNIYYGIADETKLYPHMVFNIESVNLNDINRRDYYVDIDIWDRSTSAINVEELADRVQDAFNAKNLPQNTILPTFFLIDRKNVEDEDKKIKHRLIRIQAQIYEKGE